MIRHILPHHDSVVADYWVQAWQATFPQIDFEARRPWILGHLQDMRAGGHLVRGYFDDGQSLGFYTLFADKGLIEQICVNSLAKGRGIGMALMADAALQTHQQLNLVVNEDNQVARQFYAKLGFREVERGINPSSSRRTITLQMTAKTSP